MTQQGLTRQEKLGDITFGIPGDIHPLNQPYGFYTFLGIMPTATKAEIRAAYKKLAARFHPDRNKDKPEAEREEAEEKFKRLEDVIDVLLDDGDELGQEHSQRRQYDYVSSLESYFDGFIQQGDNRTKKLSEIMLINMQIKRKKAKAIHEFRTTHPEEYAKLSKLEEEAQKIISSGDKSNLTETGKKKRIKEILEEMNDISAKGAGLTPEARNEIDEAVKKAAERHHEEQRKFAQSFGQNSRKYFAKVLDIFYLGRGETPLGFSNEWDVTFNTEGRFQLGLGMHEERGDVLELILAGENYIHGFSQVHFKSEKANVRVTDPHLEGIVHIVEGKVSIDYEEGSYGKVIRARAPNVQMEYGFVKHGELYVAERFAQGEWWKKKPALDVAVQDGSVTLHLAAQEIGRRQNQTYKYLEELIDRKSNNLINKTPNIINDLYHNYKIKY
ncbi:J domain-containing protein [Candidatus Woesearchaeota archaeon]|nr:J domain-containing protein [Candidatus Woesearchaeota archaeon]